MKMKKILVKKKKKKKGVEVIIFKKEGSFMNDIKKRFRFGK